MALLTRDDLRHQSRFAWFCLAALAASAVLFWLIDKRGAAGGTLLAIIGCLGVMLPPRERMAVLPMRLRRVPRDLDATPVLASLLSTPGYGLDWFHGQNPYDEVVHLVSGLLAGAVLAAMVLADGKPRGAWRIARHGLVSGFAIAVGWEVLEWILGIIGDTFDTVTDILLTTFGVAAGAVLWQRGRR